jgi:hypothetical protein
MLLSKTIRGVSIDIIYISKRTCNQNKYITLHKILKYNTNMHSLKIEKIIQKIKVKKSVKILKICQAKQSKKTNINTFHPTLFYKGFWNRYIFVQVITRINYEKLSTLINCYKTILCLIILALNLIFLC